MKTNNSDQKQIELKDVHDVLSNIHATLKESLKWTKFVGLKQVKPELEAQLNSDPKKIIYMLSDGVNSSYDIAKKIGNESIRRSISNYWNEWEKAGIGESIPAQGGGNRFRHSFELGDFGIEVPEITKQETQQTAQTETKEQPKQEDQSNAI